MNPKKIQFTTFYKKDEFAPPPNEWAYPHEYDLYQVVIGSYGTTQSFIIDGKEYLMLSLYQAGGAELLEVFDISDGSQTIWDKVMAKFKNPINQIQEILRFSFEEEIKVKQRLAYGKI